MGALRGLVYYDEWMKQTVIGYKKTFGDKFLQGCILAEPFKDIPNTGLLIIWIGIQGMCLSLCNPS